MNEYVLIVHFDIDPADREQFLPLILENARRCLEDEPGCRQFDVLLDKKDPGRITLYEVYDDDAAFEQHRKTPHFLEFKEKAAPLLRKQTLVPLARAAEK